MAITTLILGQSGTGKSTSIKTLDPKETFILNVLDKPLPFRGYKAKYKPISNEGSEGNYYATDDYNRIMKAIKLVNDKRTEIKNLIIDDYQYVLCNEFMRRSSETGYAKFTDIGRNAWSVLNSLTSCRSDLFCFVLSHSDLDADNRYKCKTIGKMLDDKITVEGMFTVVLHTQIIDGNYKFLTQNSGQHIAKSPAEMFKDKYIPNDLQYVRKEMDEYYNSDLEM